MKQLVTMEVIQWTALWGTFQNEFENEKNMLGGSLGEKAAEDLKLRVIEHVMLLQTSSLCLVIYFHCFLIILIFVAEYPCRL